MLRIRLWFAAAAAVIAITGLGIATPMGARADVPSGSFTTLARADAFRVEVNATNLPVNQITDTSGPSAQSKLDSLGDSEGWAAVLYPGDTIATAPGIATGQVPGGPPAPSYPLQVRSQSSGQPDVNASQGPVTLVAHSSDQDSTGRAEAAGADMSGNAIGKAVGDSSVKVDNAGKLTSDASSDVESLTISGTLRIGAMTATAHSQTSPDRTSATASSFRTEGVTVAGTTVGLSDTQGLTLPGSNQPLPDTSSVAHALQGAGIQVTPVKPVSGPGSVSSGGVTITVTENLPSGPGQVIYTLGVVHAETSGQAQPSSSVAATDNGSGSAASGPDTGSGTQAGPTGGSGGPAQGSGGTPGAGGTALAGSPGAAGGSSPLSPLGSSASPKTGSPASRGTPSSASAGGQTASSVLAASSVSSLSVYLVLIAGAVVAISAAFLFRLFAVRLAWIT